MVWQALLPFAAFFLSFMPGTPVNRHFTYIANALIPNARPAVEHIIELYLRGKIDEKTFYDGMAIYGYNKKYADMVLEAHKRLNSAEELLVAKWRGIINEDEYYKRMEALGLDKEKADLFEKVRYYFPSPVDLIRFGVRDVFREDIVKKYGYDEDFPEDIKPWLRKTGMTEDVMKLYWRAHWELPSPTQVYEMFLRLNPDVLKVVGDKYKEMGINPEEILTDIDTVREYLRVADYPRYWRDRLLALAYPPITRVDLRRIYAMGLITDEELIARLQELGYTRKDAELLAEFYKRYKNDVGFNLTRTQILDAFKMKLITEDEAKKLLQEIGYDEDEADFIIELEKNIQEQKLLDEKIYVLRRLYIRGEKTLDELRKELEELDIPQAKIEYELERAEREKKSATKLPSKTDLIRWYEEGIITEDEFRDYMKKLGYSEKFIDYYIKEVSRR